MSFIVAAPDVVQEDGPTVVIADGEEELSMKRKNLSILTKNKLSHKFAFVYHCKHGYLQILVRFYRVDPPCASGEMT